MPEVSISELRPACDPASFSFKTTAEVAPYIGLIGQERAIEAIKFGLGIESRGFNICVVGEPGTGRTTAVREYLEAFSATKSAPDEWCYVNNFVDSHQPRALRLPPGKGRELDKAMAAMVNEAKVRIPSTFQSDDFVNRRDEIIESVQRHREGVFAQLAEQARAGGFQLQGNPSGFFLVPIRDDKPLDDQSFAALSATEREESLARRDQLMEQLRAVMKQEQGLEAAANERLAELQRTIATNVAEALIEPQVEEFGEFAEVVEYLEAVRQDMIEHIGDFQPPPAEQMVPGGPAVRPGISPLRKYEVNLLIDCAEERCALVVFESNPTPQRLLGRIEKEALFGTVTTDFTMIRPGSLHAANGGYLVLDLDDVLQYPLSWTELKRTIRTGQITIEEMGDRLGMIETKTVRPEPIPWTGKIIAVAREPVYRSLYTSDPDFRELFKVKADFDMHIDRTREHEAEFAGLIAKVTKQEGLTPFDSGAVARVIDESVRMAEDHNKLSVRFGELTDVMREAAHWATLEQALVVSVEHVSRAVRERVTRVNLIEEHVREQLARGVIMISSEGSAVGQVNGLTVIELGDTAFGQPSRITATIGIGREGVLDLQREAHLAGPIYSKAVLTLQGFLVDRYAVDAPITLAARLSFEQSYGMVEGDSATCAETCALLSRLAEVPLRQSLAITGSMDQKGEVQAIGGANEKIEGFYDVCRLRGLTGDQGVIIPASNVQHLMLREDVVEAVRTGKFVIHAVSTVDEAIELLTGMPAGAKDATAHYAADSINGRVQARLLRFANQMRSYSGGDYAASIATEAEEAAFAAETEQT